MWSGLRQGESNATIPSSIRRFIGPNVTHRLIIIGSLRAPLVSGDPIYGAGAHRDLVESWTAQRECQSLGRTFIVPEFGIDL